MQKSPVKKSGKLRFSNKNENIFCIVNIFVIGEYNERTIMAAIRDLRDRVDKLHVITTKIYTATCTSAEMYGNIAGIPTLPLTSMGQFRNWEDFLVDEENKLIMVRKYFILRSLYFRNIVLYLDVNAPILNISLFKIMSKI